MIARQSTARTLMIGPVLDASGVAVTDGVVGDFKISKNGGAPAALNGSATATHRHTGFYSLALTASDLDTVGQAEITIDDTVNAMPLRVVTVVEEAVYDALFAASATGLLPANVTQFGGSNGTFASGRPEVNTTHWGGTAVASAVILAAANIASDAITAAKIAADAITSSKIADGALTAAKFASGAFDAVWSVATRLLTAGTNIVLAKGTGVTGFNDLSAAQVNAEADTALADAGVTTTRTGYLDNLSAGAVATAAKLLSYFQSALRKDVTVDADIGGNYDDATDSQEAIRDRGDAAWTTATGFSTHSAADVWAVGTRTLTAIDEDTTTLDLDATIRGAVGLASANLDTQLDALPTAAENADAVWDEATAGHTTSGTFGEQVKTDVDAILADTDVIGTPAGASVSADVAAVKSDTAAILLDTGTDGVVVAAASKTGYRLSATGVDDVLDEAIGDSTITMRQALKLAVATLAGKLSGAATTTVTIRNAADDTDVVVAGVDADGNRTSVTLSL